MEFLGYYIRYCKQKIREKEVFCSDLRNKFCCLWPLPSSHSYCQFFFFFFFQALLERTGYTLDVTTGQRKYGGPPPDTVYSGVQPGIGTEVSMHRLIPLFCVLTQSHLLKDWQINYTVRESLKLGGKLTSVFVFFSLSLQYSAEKSITEEKKADGCNGKIM